MVTTAAIWYLSRPAAYVDRGVFFMGDVQAFWAPVIFYIIMDKVFIPHEEEKLLSSFGNRYAQYRNQKRRWL